MKTQYNGARSATQAVRHGVKDLAHDVMVLVELQAKLLKVDLREGVSRLVAPLIMTVVGMVSLVASLPVLLLAVSALLQEYAGMTASMSLLLASLCGLAIAALLAGWAIAMVRRAFPMMERSRTEFIYNMEWMKHVLSRHRQNEED